MNSFRCFLIIFISLFVLFGLVFAGPLLKENFVLNAPSNITYSSKPQFFDSNNYNVVYHDTPEDITAQGGIYSTEEKKLNVMNPKTGKLIELPFYGIGPIYPIYNPPNTFKYGTSASYIPNYESSVYLGMPLKKSVKTA